MGLWSMFFGDFWQGPRIAEAEVAEQPDRREIVQRLRDLQAQCGKFAPLVRPIAEAIETGVGPNGRQSTPAEQAHALFILSKLLRRGGLRRAAVEVAALWMELNLLAHLA